jgi:hypothetical protein
MDIVFHSSKKQGLKVIEPRISTHENKWVYAADNISIAAMFLGNNSDFICQTGLDDNKPFIWERFEGAFKVAYMNVSGSIYILSGRNFKKNQTSWSGDLVSTKKEKVIKEIRIDEVRDFIKSLATEKKLDIYYYPHFPAGLPNDKSDIIEKAVDWTLRFGTDTLEEIKLYHTDILPIVLKKLSDQGYKHKSLGEII